MRKLMITCMLIAICAGVSAQKADTIGTQGFSVPQYYVMYMTTGEYSRFDGDIARCVDWLLATPITNQKGDLYDNACVFLQRWIQGNQSVTVLAPTQLIPGGDAPPILLLIYAGGWAKQALQSPPVAGSQNGYFAGAMAGVEAMIKLYTLNKVVLGTNDTLENLIRLQKRGKLEDYVRRVIEDLELT